jgi:hypothetical protein
MTDKIDLSCEGRLEVTPFVNQKKYEAMSEMISHINLGGYAGERASVDLKETLSTTDGAHSLAHLANVRNLPQWDEAERSWSKIAAVETVDDFEPITFQRLEFDFSNLEHGLGTGGNAVSPRVPELGTYSYAFGYTEEDVKAAIEKRGFKFGLSLERILSKLRPTVRSLPDDMLQIALDTDEFLVFDALQSGVTAATDLAAGTAPISGASITANAPFSVDALRLGLSQIGERTDSKGRKVKLAPQYYVVVSQGRAQSIEDELEFARSLQGVRQDISSGQLVYGRQPLGNLGKIAGVIESEWITDTDAWYVVPAAGTTRRPGLVKLQLAGRTAPEILVHNLTGILTRGGNGSSPFDLAHFDNDSVDLKLRQFTNSKLILEEQIVWSNGSGS